ncbi:MAG: family oxidoreductase [Cyanobacteria bacterium RYN_339]|nr:family oxidoreductase [Cyanobacteria bacterium RYN_339]
MPTIAITGASGQLGQLVTRLLAAQGVREVRLGSRNPEGLDAHGYATLHADFDDFSSLEALFQDADVALLISSNGDPETRQRQHRTAIDAAKAAKVKRVVFTSFTNPTPATRFPLAAANEDSESYLVASGLDYTILRNNQYLENLEATLAQSKQNDTLFIPGVAGKVAYISREDIAEVIAAVLTGEGHEGKTYELTGDEAVSIVELAALLTEARGRRVTAVDAPPADFGNILGGFGLEPFLVDALLGMYAASDAGEYASVSGDVARILGRKPAGAAGYVRGFV